MEVVGELYWEFYHKENEKRKRSDHATKLKELMKLRSFELTCLSFESISNHLGAIQRREMDIGAKLLDAKTHSMMEFTVHAANRLRIETLVLQEYYEEMKINLRREEENADYKSRKIDRKRMNMPTVDKLHVSYLVSLRGMLQETSRIFARLKNLSTEN